MTPQNQLEVNGKIKAHPFAELITEINQAELTGSLRLTCGSHKTIVYFADGTLVYAASNARQHRLFDILLRAGKIGKKELAENPNFANDVEFSAALESSGVISKPELNNILAAQILAIITDALTWEDGEWLFNPLARPRADLTFPVDVTTALLNFGRCVHSSVIAERFKSMDEQFALAAEPDLHFPLLSHEGSIIRLIGDQPFTIDQLRQANIMPEAEMLQGIYALWISGWLTRQGWNSAFSAANLESIGSAKLSRVKEAKSVALPKPPAPEPDAEIAEMRPGKIPDAIISLDDYLARSESAKSHYERLGIETDTPLAMVKVSYFSLAKLYHPDKFHREGPELLGRVQVAFTQLSQAYETLRNSEARENYDYKLRKEAELEAKRRAEGKSDTLTQADKFLEQGAENYDAGLQHLEQDDHESAAKCFARALHYAPRNALYHAYYGKALSAFDKMRHKAESELQTAANLEPQNPQIRLMLAEFFIDMKLIKRAEGELKRFLQANPGNQEAEKLLARIRV
ncbi:MAG: DnaJ domain-containing protein [Blastocatellia bacterium]|nr:DnaJ domain-containing protein [Blastocatellia bacterium]